MCGLIGIVGNHDVAPDIYDALITLQHRGQDAAGIATYDSKIHVKKESGLVRDIFGTEDMMRLKGNVGVGHTRYSTVGGLAVEDAQPFFLTAPYGIVMAHNGNLVNFHELKKEIIEHEKRLINSNNDIEVILHIFATSLQNQNIEGKIQPEHIYTAVEEVYKRCKGGYAVVGFIAGQGLFAFRDPHGIRPLVFGSNNEDLNKEYAFTSENIALDLLGYKLERSVKGGEAIFVDSKRGLHSKQIGTETSKPSIFEYVYFARPDSIIDDISVYKSRLRLGKILAQRIREQEPDLQIDVVCPVPDSSRTAALELAQELGVRYREGLVKNRYIGRTFIMPGQEGRKKSIRYKLNAMKLELKGKNVLLVDDSIVRGNTSRKIVELVRDAGANQVFFSSYSSPVISPDIYGIDIPSYSELIAHGMTNEQICQSIGADKLFYQTFEDMVNGVRGDKFPDQEFETSCFSGEYIVGDITPEMLAQHDAQRCCEKKDSHEGDPLHLI